MVRRVVTAFVEPDKTLALGDEFESLCAYLERVLLVRRDQDGVPFLPPKRSIGESQENFWVFACIRSDSF